MRIRGLAAVSAFVTAISLVVVAPAGATDNRPGYNQLMAQIATSVMNPVPNLTTTVPPFSKVAGSGEGRIPLACFSRDYRQGVPVDAARRCAFGMTTSAHTILLIGDDNALQWLPAISAAAYDLHWKVVFIGKPQCSAWAYRSYAGTAACRHWMHQAVAFANSYHARWVIPIGAKVAWRGTKNASINQLKMEIAGTLNALAPSRSRILLFEMIPQFVTGYTNWTPYDCLIRYAANVKACMTVLHNYAVTSTGSLALYRYAVAHHLKMIPSMPFFCNGIRCALYVSGPSGTYLVYRDRLNMSRYYANYISKALAAMLWKTLN